ncbi:hypothetical protein [Polaromonas sp.]|uniref:hypothetical protein n=1 Tax=Polaromonas sp. TaxID=1869339 RepID=UPI00352A28FB
MKTDTEDTVRVTVTFNRASNPEWYNVLRGIESGRARSEIVKTHLSLPSEQRFGQGRRGQAPAAAPVPPGDQKGDLNTPSPTLNTGVKSTVDNVQISSESAEKKPAALAPAAGGDTAVNSTPRSTGGLAARLIDGGFKGI